MVELSVAVADQHVWKEWVSVRHYAKTVPIVTEAFVLIQDGAVNGVCTYGPPARQLNDGGRLFGRPLPCRELNRLVVGDGLPENGLSWFVSRTLKELERPSCVVSYADPNNGHHGYIYQALGWLYLGTTSDTVAYQNAAGRPVHARSVVAQYGTRRRADLPVGLDVVVQEGKHRYLTILGSGREKRALKEALTYPVLPYPKGDNDRYEPEAVGQQGVIF